MNISAAKPLFIVLVLLEGSLWCVGAYLVGRVTCLHLLCYEQGCISTFVQCLFAGWVLYVFEFEVVQVFKLNLRPVLTACSNIPVVLSCDFTPSANQSQRKDDCV